MRDVPVDVKVVAASNASLSQAVAEQRFRADLYMRLSPATRVVIPPLRERLADLRHFATRFALAALEDHDLAELRDRVAVALGLGRGAQLSVQIERGARASDPGGLVLQLPPPAFKLLAAHAWPGNLRELATVMQNIVTFTLVAAVDALGAGLRVRSPRLQVDPGLVAGLLAGSGVAAVGRRDVRADERGVETGTSGPDQAGHGDGAAAVPVRVRAGRTLNAVAQDVERQYMLALFSATGGSFSAMAEILLGDAQRTRAVRLRFNQLGLKVRALRRP
jgi:DNA-binding NtrC family response regulator